MIRRLGSLIQNLFKWIGRTFDFSDVIGLIGLGGVFYGFYLWKQYLAYIIVGFIIFGLSVLTGIKK